MILDTVRTLDSLKPHPRNYNVHPPAQVRRLADKMRLHAFTAPFIVNPAGVILGGHGRRLALLLLRGENYPEPEGVLPGWRVPCREFTGTAVAELALLAGDNPDRDELEYDPEALTALLVELQQHDALDGSGYSLERLDALISELSGQPDPADFEPGGAGEQGRLDERAKVECPECGCCFVPSR